MADSTRSLLFGVFVLASRPLTAAQVIRLTRPLGVSATNAKSHLTRMVAAGALDRSGPPRARRYAPSSGQSTVVQGIHARLQDAPAEAWDGAWLALTLRLPAERGERERLTASLWFDGFRPWAPGTFVRPAWPGEWAVERARHYLAHAAGFCLRGPFVEPLNLRKVAALYGLAALDREARTLARRIGRQRPPGDAGERAFAARLEVGGRVARLIGHDPRLPAALWGGRTGMLELVRAFRDFELSVASRAQQFLDQVIATQPGATGRRPRRKP
jgi:phenylacetic acid degradation operon negative regulatory protein